MIFEELIFDYTLRNVAFGSGVLGVVSGFLGTIVVLRKQSLLGDAMSHAALPGIALAFLILGTKDIFILLLGAGVSALLATFFIYLTVNSSKIKFDSSLAIWLSTFFGLGIVLLTIIQRFPNANQAGLDKFLFGQAAALTHEDLRVMLILGGISVFLVLLLWKEIKILIFDPSYAKSLGINLKLVDLLVITLVVIAIMIGLQTVGVILMSSMLIAPALAARQWTDRFSLMVLLSAVFGITAGMIGSIMSSKIPKMPTGPSIIVCVSTIVLFSIMFSPKYGLVSQKIRAYRSDQDLRLNAVLENLLKLSKNHNDPFHPHSINVLKLMGNCYRGIDLTLKRLEKQGLVANTEKDEWMLTKLGYERVKSNLRVLKR